MCVCVCVCVCMCVCVYIYICIYMCVYIYVYIERDCGFIRQQRVLKKFPGPGYLCSVDGVV